MTQQLMNLKFTQAQTSQLKEVSALFLRTFLEYNTAECSQESITEFTRLTSAATLTEYLEWNDKLPKFYNIWVCTDEDTGEIVGAAAAYYDRLDNLFVDKRYHRNGIARRLFAMFLEEFNPAVVRLYASFYAQDFYRKIGFVGDEEKVINSGQRVIYMTYKHEGGEVKRLCCVDETFELSGGGIWRRKSARDYSKGDFCGDTEEHRPHANSRNWQENGAAFD